ncbi:recombinase family protein [Neoaquamicrobium sediminum]|uniref:recombinase family protein n=1 Tax=Neoaquamicrobium sediminum TaxID=1849104 RepID=UPI003BAC7C59
MRRIAYLRVSTAEQRPDRQIEGLKHIADELHIETLSAVAKHRPVYERVVERLSAGDALVIWDLDRAYRTSKDAINEMDALRARGIHFHIANLHLDTTTPHGRLIYTVLGALAEFEREILAQRTKEGIEAARRRGKRIGRPPKLTDRQLANARRRIETRGQTRAQIAAEHGMTPWSLTQAIKRHVD